MTTYNQLLAKIDRIEVLASSGLCSFLADNWRHRLKDIQDVIQSKDEPSFEAPEVHPDDIAIDKFAAAMKAKMADRRAHGRGGWEKKDECSTRSLQEMLAFHVYKGDPVDIGNFAMMFFNRGERTAVNDASGLRPMLEILQRCGMSVARAIEIIERWQIGRHTSDDLPREEQTDPKILVQRLIERASPDAASGSVYALLQEAAQRIQDHEECDNDRRRLVRELDVLLNGEAGAAKQAALCDIVGQVRREMSGLAMTDAAKRLLALADDPTSGTPTMDRQQLRSAAHELDRYYKGWLAWKRTAEEKDLAIANGNRINRSAFADPTDAELSTIYDHDREDGWCGHDVSAESLKAIFKRLFNLRREK